jgi:hypothetical protein
VVFAGGVGISANAFHCGKALSCNFAVACQISCEHLPDERYVVLKQEYKPPGFKTMALVNYEEHPVAAKFKGLTPKIAAKISSQGSEDFDSIFLYNDGCIPTRSAQREGRRLHHVTEHPRTVS